MRFRATLLAILVLLSTFEAGCYRNIERQMVAAELPGSINDHVLSATLRDGRRMTFGGNGAVYEWQEIGGNAVLCIVGIGADGASHTIEVSKIAAAEVRTRRTDGARSIMMAAGIFCFGVLVAGTVLSGSEIE